MGRGARDVLMEPGNRDDEQMAVRQAVASGEDEGQHDENRVRKIHIGKRGANEERPDKLRKTYDPSRMCPVHRHPQPCPSLESLVSGERQNRPEPVLVQNSGHPDDDIQILWWIHFLTRWMDERVVTSKKSWIGIEKDAGDLRRKEKKEMVEKMSEMNAIELNFWKREKSVENS